MCTQESCTWMFIDTWMFIHPWMNKHMDVYSCYSMFIHVIQTHGCLFIIAKVGNNQDVLHSAGELINKCVTSIQWKVIQD